MQHDGFIRMDDYRRDHRKTPMEVNAVSLLDMAEAAFLLMRERQLAAEAGLTPLPELLVDRKPTPVGAIPAVEILDPTEDLAGLGIHVTDELDGEVL